MKSADEGTDTYLPELVAEKEGLEALDKPYVHASRLLNGEIERVQKGSDVNKELEKHYRDVMGRNNIKLSERVLIPAKQHPKFNFVGKLLGPMGNTLKRLQTETGTRMAILGRGCMKDKAKEEEMRSSTEAKYDHLNDELHIQIEVYAPLEEAYCRMGQAVEEVKKYLIPVGQEPESNTIVAAPLSLRGEVLR
uniref:KH domain-containing, RNA-binding, signal transduction-associated protein 2-like n=1 Tax=Myxine glutinosa TaxID=7769 RepID=UPI00358E0343